jgi:hypothetical protein
MQMNKFLAGVDPKFNQMQPEDPQQVIQSFLN